MEINVLLCGVFFSVIIAVYCGISVIYDSIYSYISSKKYINKQKEIKKYTSILNDNKNSNIFCDDRNFQFISGEIDKNILQIPQNIEDNYDKICQGICDGFNDFINISEDTDIKNTAKSLFGEVSTESVKRDFKIKNVDIEDKRLFITVCGRDYNLFVILKDNNTILYNNTYWNIMLTNKSIFCDYCYFINEEEYTSKSFSLAYEFIKYINENSNLIINNMLSDFDKSMEYCYYGKKMIADRICEEEFFSIYGDNLKDTLKIAIIKFIESRNFEVIFVSKNMGNDFIKVYFDENKDIVNWSIATASQ